MQDKLNKKKEVTGKDEASNMAILSSTSKQDNVEDKHDPNVADSGQSSGNNNHENSQANAIKKEKEHMEVDTLDSHRLKIHTKAQTDTQQDEFLEGALQEEEDLQGEVDGEDGDGLDYNIQHISQASDISPRHTEA